MGENHPRFKALGFIELNDGSSFSNLQVVFEDANISNFKEIAKCNVGTALRVTGTLMLTPNAKQPCEIHACEVVVEGVSAPDYPLQKKRHSVEFLRTIAHLRPRTNLFNAAFRVRSEAAFAIHQFFHDRGFVYAHTPLITASDAEGAGDMFHVTTLDLNNVPKTADGQVDYSQDFFGSPTNLTVSGQLEAETFGPGLWQRPIPLAPRSARKTPTRSRHAAEFWMIEPEIAFADLKDNMALGSKI